MWARVGTSLVAGLAAMILAGAASAQPSPSARQLDLAQRYVKAMNLEASMNAVMDQLAPTMIEGRLDSLTPEEREAFLGVMRDVSQKMMARMGARMAPILAEMFTEKELEDVVAFYEGPSGKAMIEKGPQLGAKMAPLMKELMPEAQSEMFARMCEILDCDETIPSATPS